jgi:hypothetical protein
MAPPEGCSGAHGQFMNLGKKPRPINERSRRHGLIRNETKAIGKIQEIIFIVSL